ncbi:pirin family protein [Alicyclobacillus sp.]|uniref:pirin family protein n=1 Tax=Alicyclobacillus sp. TaxID=61169 RepID=UPI0025BEF58D|nr:pirin family protein [Alicyclobacillus sp.]
MAQSAVYERPIARVWKPVPKRQSAIHTVAMVLEPGHWAEFDPFLLMAEDWFQSGTFDLHPHRGIETVTYVIEGHLRHFDNRNGSGELGPGDVQWMTAGRGVIHEEDPVPGETVHSLQLWVNLPRSEKMAEPRYQNLLAKDMPVRGVEGGWARVFSGSSGGVQAPTKNHVPVTMVDIHLDAGASFMQDLPGDYNGFLYVLEGRGRILADGTEGAQGQVLWLGRSDKAESRVTIEALESLHVLLYAGRPVREPVVAYGPFVMNTRQEILQAIEDYQNGRFA